VTLVVDGLATVLARVGGQLHALDSVCPHAGGPLGDGDLDDDAVVCPYHGWAFDLRTGACAVDPSLIVPVHHVVEDVDGALVRLRLAVMPEVR
jgi:nitrite reductase/ring-hydroxylating ferredoxin subunit